ncbi:tryptophan 2,3-dioxygenase [Shouchella patagoniensis]|uniref:tryptophan 2,3-dioxygenase n=1 Tax=Shouchella patagoniensis TaxID=228576 RepID=UPI00099594E3|nr:tryptophan 2,3-dioxygenase [Shouchella patagoniensis]
MTNKDHYSGLHTDFKEKMTYGDYLQLDSLLSSQNRLSGHHDEMLFIIIHQVSELWMKLMIHEIKGAIHSIKHDQFQPAFKQLSRVSKTQAQIIQAWDVLSTLTPSEYSEFRDSLGQASGFQSYQHRQLEFALGKKSDHILKIYAHDQALHEDLLTDYEKPSLYDEAIYALSRAGLSIDDDLLQRDITQSHTTSSSVLKAWQKVYQNTDQYWNLYQLAEKLVDLEDRHQQWRFRHLKTVERIIGLKSGTGGSKGVHYLKAILDEYFFPELWQLRTSL